MDHGKSYDSEQERQHRLSVFEENYRFVTAHNAQPNASSFTIGLNAFADLTSDEFRARFLGGLIPSSRDSIIRLNRGFDLVEDSEIPDSLDWRKRGAVSKVKNQGSCGEHFLLLIFCFHPFFPLQLVGVMNLMLV